MSFEDIEQTGCVWNMKNDRKCQVLSVVARSIHPYFHPSSMKLCLKSPQKKATLSWSYIISLFPAFHTFLWNAEPSPGFILFSLISFSFWISSKRTELLLVCFFFFSLRNFYKPPCFASSVYSVFVVFVRTDHTVLRNIINFVQKQRDFFIQQDLNSTSQEKCNMQCLSYNEAGYINWLKSWAMLVIEPARFSFMQVV